MKYILNEEQDFDLKNNTITTLDPELAKKRKLRVTELTRLRLAVEEAIKKFTEAGNETQVKKLEARLQEINSLISGVSVQDLIDDEDNDIENDQTDEQNLDDGQEDESEDEETKEESENEESENEETDDESEDEDWSEEEDENNSNDEEEESGEEDNKTDIDSDEPNNKSQSEEETENSQIEKENEDEEKIESDPQESSESTETDFDQTEQGKSGDGSKQDTTQSESDEENVDPSQSKSGSEDNNDKEDASEKDKADEGKPGQDSSKSEDNSNDKSNSEDNDDNSADKQKNNGVEQDTDGENDDSDDSNSEEEEEETEEEAVKNPFQNQGENGNPMSKKDGKEARDATIDDIKKMLAELSAEGKRGAADALRQILADRNEPLTDSYHLTEAIKKSVEELTDDEYNNLINSTIDLIDQVAGIKVSDDINQRKIAIKQLANNRAASKELEVEDNLAIRAANQAKKANDNEAQRYRNYRSIDQFKINFFNTIKDQVKMVEQEYQSYDEINPEYEGEDIIVKADLIAEIPDNEKPSIDVYFDQSGSFNDDDIALGNRILATLKEFEDRDEIKLNIFYFANHVHTTAYRARSECGTSAWYEILTNIKATGAKNVVLFTDSDMDNLAEWYKTRVTVDGCVWYIWKRSSAPNLPNYLKGRSGTSEYMY